MDHRYKLPRSLQESKLVVPAERKPAALAALLQVGGRCIGKALSVSTLHPAVQPVATHQLHPSASAMRSDSGLCVPRATQEAAKFKIPRSPN